MSKPLEQTDDKASTQSMPDAFIILFVIIIVASVLTYIVPAGKFEVETYTSTSSSGETVEKTRIVEDSFSFDENADSGVPLFASGGNIGTLNYAFEGMVSGSKFGSAIGVVAFIIIVGGAFGVITQTGAIHNGMLRLIEKTQNTEALLIPIIFVTFSLGGAIFGMGEEAIAFSIIIVPLIVALGYDAITGVLITYVATQIGFATSWMNPFSVAIAQGIADLPLLSGQEYRMLLWFVFTSIGLLYTWRYSRAVKRGPSKSLSKSSNEYFRKQQVKIEANFTGLDQLILGIFALGIVWVIYGVIVHAYYIPEIATQFFAIAIVIGLVSWLGKRQTVNEISEAFQTGAKELLPAALIVGMAKGIILILGGDDLDQPSTLNTMLFYASNAIGESSSYLSAWIMLVFQSVFNFFVASGSGQAAITMPLMAPLADLLGLTRQIAVLAFQLGDGLSNIVIPTSASLIGCLGVARIDWSIWIKFVWKLFLILFGLATASMLIAVTINY